MTIIISLLSVIGILLVLTPFAESMSSFVSDEHGYLYHKDKRVIENAIYTHKSYPCSSSTNLPYRYGIVIKDYSDRYDANDVYQRLNMESRHCDNGVLLYVTVRDRSMSIVTGKDIPFEIFGSLERQAILDKMKNYFKNEKYSEGIKQGTLSLITILHERSDLHYNYNSKTYIERDTYYGDSHYNDNSFSATSLIVILLFFTLFGSLGCYISGNQSREFYINQTHPYSYHNLYNPYTWRSHNTGWRSPFDYYSGTRNRFIKTRTTKSDTLPNKPQSTTDTWTTQNDKTNQSNNNRKNSSNSTTNTW